MLRFYYVILVSLPSILFYLLVYYYVATHKDRFSELQKYHLVQRWIAIIKRSGRIKTDVYGLENLPEEGGYVMYSNHQGKYDALGIISSHKKPCTFVIDEKRSRLPLIDQVSNLLEASRLDKENIRNQLQTMTEVIHQVQNGRRVIIFPEGGYDHNENQLQEFMPGTFKCSIRSHTPIIPVALRDSYKVFGVNSLKKVRTEVHFLKPLYYEEYKELSSRQIANLVKERIRQVIETDGFQPSESQSFGEACTAAK